MSINPYEPSRAPESLTNPIFELPAEIEYQQTMDDIVAFALDYNRRSVVHRASLGCISVVVLGIVVVAFLDFGGVTIETVTFAGFFVLAFLIVMWLARFLRHQWGWSFNDLLMGALMRYLYTRGDTTTLIGPRWLRLSRTDITERTPTSETRLATSMVQKIIVDRQRSYIYISPVQAFVVHSNAFSDPTMMDAFLAALEECTHLKAIRS